MARTYVVAADAPGAKDRIVFSGSIKAAATSSGVTAAAATVAGLDLTESMEFMIALKMRNYKELTARIAVGTIISPAEMAARYYPVESDYLNVVDWLKAQGFTIIKTDPARLGVFARGSVAQIKTSLQIDFARVDSAGKSYTSATTAPSLPVSIAPAVLGINGLQPEIQPRRHSKRMDSGVRTQIANSAPFFPSEILKAYNADTLTANGGGQKIGIVIDTFPLDSDLTSFWAQAGVTNSLSNIEKVQVVPGTLSPPSGEETLDVEWASGIAPGAKVRVYASLDLSFVHIDQVFQQIVNDLPAQQGMKQISISLGLGETFVGSAQLQTDAQYMAAIAAAGVTVCVSSGDSGSNEGGVLQVSYFASDPNVAAIGGTSLSLNSGTGTVSSETVWSGSGGGISSLFNRPIWQAGAGVPAGSTRLVPDVSAVANPNTGGFVILNGSLVQFGGTSWSAPIWAGFCARINQGRAAASMFPLGLLGPRVFPLIGTPSFRDITSGSNGAYSATSGFDLCTGVGVPHVANLYTALTAPPTQPNLQPAQPVGWSDAIVVSKKTGTNTDELLTPIDDLYVDVGLVNIGVPTSGPFSTELYVDNVLKGTFQTSAPLAANGYSTMTDLAIGRLALGTHTIRIKVDAGNAIAESSEADNEYTRTITVTPPLLFDSYAGASMTNTASTPRNFMGIPITLGANGGTSNIPVAGGTAYLRTTTSANYTAIRLNITFWGAASGATSGNTPAFSNPLGTYSFDLGPLNATAGATYPYTFTLPTAVIFPAQAGGVTINWQGNTGAGLVSTDNLTSTIRYGGTPQVGSLTLGTPGENGYYRNASGETDGNFLGSSFRLLGGLTNQGLALQLYAPTPVPGPPTIVNQPGNATAGTGGSVNFSVYATGDPAPAYQWQRQPAGTTGFSNLASNSIPGVTIGGIDTSALSLAGVLFGMSGDQFRCVVSNSFGSATTSVATLTVNAYPVITQQPADATVAAGQSVTLSAAATAGSTVTYQWRRNGLPIAGATGATFTLANPHVSDGGNYNVVAKANGLETFSNVVTLAVTPTRYPGTMYLDPTFAPSIETVGGTIRAIARQTDGKLLIGSEGCRINGTPLRYLARLNTDGSVDNSFSIGTGPNATVYVIVVQQDGKILIGGDFTSYDGSKRGRIARLNANGSLDLAFDTIVGADSGVYAIALAADGSVQLGGNFTVVNGVTRNRLARLNANTGALVTSFDPGTGPNASVTGMVFQSDGKLLVNGYFSTFSGLTRMRLARVNTNGSLDANFSRPVSPANDEEVNAIALQTDGKIVVAGWGSTVSYRVSRLNTDGSVDPTFNIGSGPSSISYAVAIQPDGRILVGGYSALFNNYYSPSIVRLFANGSIDSSFAQTSPDVLGPAYALVLMPDGKIALGGSFYNGNSSTTGLLRMTSTGVRDTGFNVETRVPGIVNEMLQQTDGKLLIGGNFNYVNGTARGKVARLHPTGALDLSFNPGIGFDNTVETMVLQPDGKLVAGGEFFSYNSVFRAQVARINADGSLDTTFDPGGGPNSIAFTALAMQADGKFLVGGAFTIFAGTPRNHIARLNSNGTLDLTFNPGAGSNGWPLFDFTLQPDGRLLFAGWFGSYNNTTRNGLARILADGALDTSFAPVNDAFNYGESLLLQSDGKVIFSGFYGLTRYLANGATDGTFVAPTTLGIGTARAPLPNIRAQANGIGLDEGGISRTISTMVAGAGTVGRMFQQADGKLLIGQAMNSSGGPIGIARLTANGALDSSFSVGDIFGAKVSRFIMLDDGQLLVSGALFDDKVVQQSGVARFTFVVTPTITAQPVAQSVNAGSNVTFSVAGAGGALHYQWYRSGSLISGATESKLVLTNVTAANAGQYTVTLANGAGTITSNAATLEVIIPAAIANQPMSRSVGVGGLHTFKVGATGTATLLYQWRKNGAVISGATNSELPFSAVAVGDAGSYDVVVSNTGGSVTSNAAILTVLPNPSSFSSRQFISATGATASFAFEGNQTKHLLLRAVGPGLTTFGVSGVLADPQITVLDANGVVIASNDNWGTVTGVNLSSIFAQVGAFPLASGSADAALYATLAPGAYQVKVSGVGATTGIALLELYDADTNSSTRLAYVGMRGRMESSSGGLSATLAMQNSANKRMLIRAIGPTLGDASALGDPQLQIYDGAIAIASNDNWGNASALITAAGQAGAFPLPASSLDAALLIDQRIGAGSYLATVPYAGPDRDALVEIYDINAAGVPAFAPLVVIPPVSVTELAQNPVTFRAFAVGGGTLSYQWQRNGADIPGATTSTLTVAAPQIADAGFYVLKVSSSFGNATSSPATLTLPPGIGSFTPASATQGATITVNGSGFTGATAVKFNGLNAASFTVVSNFQITAVVPTYATTGTVAVTLAGGSTATSSAALTISQGPRPIRMWTIDETSGDESAFIANFTIEGTGSKDVLLRALNLAGAGFDPVLTIYDGAGTQIASNDNWDPSLAPIFTAVGADPLPAGSNHAALVATLPQGVYTARVTGAGGTTGTTKFEVFEVSAGTSRIAHLAKRSAGTGEYTQFTLAGTENQVVLVRAVGSGLGVPGAFADPSLLLLSGTTTIASNNDWGTNPNLADLNAATAAVGAMPLAAKDAAVLVSLPAGSYTVFVSRSGPVTGAAMVEVFLVDAFRPSAFAPAILAPLVNKSVAPGDLATFAAPFVAKPAPTFKWQKGSVDIPGATNAVFQLASVSPADVGTYRVLMTNSSATVTSASAALRLAPTVTWPAAAAITYGTALSATQLNATASVPGTFVYTPAAGTVLNAGTNQTLSVTFNPTDATNYVSTTATTTISVNKASQTITFGVLPSKAANSGSFTLGATTDSGLAITYATSNSSGGTVATVSGNIATPVNAGTITITASQAGDSNYLAATPVSQVLVVTAATSPPVVPPSFPSGGGGGGGGGGALPTLPPIILTQPASQQATVGATVTFSVGAPGSDLFFQWFKDGAAIGDARSSALTLANIKITDAGAYHVVVSNTGGSITSSTATLTVVAPPTIATQPASQSVAFGANVVLNVTPGGAAPFTYQWRKDGSSIAGATGATLSLSNVTPADAGAYSVVVTNGFGSVTSANAVLAVAPRAIAGAYFGTFGNNEGTFALYVRSDRTGVFLGYLNALRTAVISRSVIIDANGGFSVTQVVAPSPAVQSADTPPVAAAGASYRIEGTISPSGVLTGTVPELNLAFNAPPAASSGASAGSTGFYQSGAAGSSSTSYAIVGPAGDAFFVTVNGTTADAGKGTVSASGALNVTTAANAVVTGSVQAATTMLSATVTPATGAATTFIGINDEARTDTEKLINISTRSQTGTTVNTLIAGFVISGDRPKAVLVRAIGPTLGSAFGVGGALSAARLELFREQTSIAVGTDWGAQANASAIAAAAVRVGAFALAANSRDASILIDLEPGAYTAVVTGQGGASGVSLVEVYDATAGPIPRDQRIINIATRATAGTGDNSLIAGFVISGAVPKRVLIRGVGPTLASFGLGGVLARPQLSVNSGATVLAQNAGWSTSPDAAAIAAGSAEVGAFAFGATSLDAALIVYLAPGPYTAQVSGVGGTTGVALIEVYELP